MLAVLKKYSFLGFIFQWLYSRSGRYGLGGGITKAGPGSPLQRTSAITPPSRTYQSPTLPLKAPPPPGSSRSSLGGELGQEDNHSAPEASPAL